MKVLSGSHAVEINVSTLVGRVLSCGMDDTQEQEDYEERLKEVFNSFDASGSGSLCTEELADLCQSLHLDDATPALLHALLQNQDRLDARVDFDQFKNALIQVLSSSVETAQAEQESPPRPESPEIQPKFVKGSKRYGRRSTPEFIEPISDTSEVKIANPLEEEQDEDLEDNYDSAVPRKRERWNAHETSTEEYEAEGQMQLWNPDEPSTPRKSSVPLPSCLEERLREACARLKISWDGYAGHAELLALCEHLSLEVSVDVLQSLSGDGAMNVQEFVSRVVNHNKPPTPSASTPYRQLKRLHSTQPFDEGGRRIATPSALTSTIGMRLFSTLDDGTGFTPVEFILDAWMEEGIENSTEILQALNFSLDGKLSLSDLTLALENELLVTKNGIHQAALASFKAEIRYLLEQVDREVREKEKIRSDLEKAEKLKSQLATEVDEHHSAIEHTNNLNLRKLEQDHKEKLAAVRSELMQELDQLQQQADLQREEMEAEVQKIREDESFLRDHLSISVKENRRLEMELLDSNEKLLEARSQITKLQTCVDNVTKERFGDLDPGSADFFLQEERIKQLRSSYEAQYRELQDRIDELQSELREFHSLGRVHQPCNKPLSEELESKSPGMESDPGIGSEEVQPFSMSLEAEMMLEHLKEQHLQEMEELRNQLEYKINEFDKMVEKQRTSHEDQKATLAIQYQQEVQALREEMAGAQSHAQELQSQLEQAELERTCLEQAQAEEREELENLQEEEVGALRQQLLEAHTYTADLEEQLKSLEAQHAEMDEKLEELREQHAAEISKLQREHAELSEARLEEERKKLQEEKAESEKRLLGDFEREKELSNRRHEEELKARLEEAKVRFEEERDEIVKKLTEQWQKEKARLDEQNNESLQALLEEEMLRLVKEQEEKEVKLREQWETERARLQEALLGRVAQERSQLQEQFEQREKRLKEEWQSERSQLEEDYEGMIQERVSEEREKLQAEEEEEEKRVEFLMAEERARLEERHQEAVKELTAKHADERDALSGMLDRLRDDIAQERKEIEISFSQRIKQVEDRFSGDQESVAKRFQADVRKLEQHYQSELKAVSESHVEEKLHWEAQMQEALQRAEEQRRMIEEERESQEEQWRKERRELEGLHEEEMEKLVTNNQRLQNELDDFISEAQTKEIELSRQLNDLHTRLQESLETRDELLAQSEEKALETELLLNRTIEDLEQEREELRAKHDEMLYISERQITERIELLTERDDLKMKIEELEMLLEQAAVDFELERRKLQEHMCILENDREELVAERDVLKIRIVELEMELDLVLSSAEKPKDAEINSFMDELLNATETCRVPREIRLHNDDNQELVCLASFPVEQTPTEDPDAVDGNIEKDDALATSDDHGDNMPEVKTNEEQGGQIFLPEGDDVEGEPRVGREADESTSSEGHDPDEGSSSLEVFEGEDGENKAAVESCEEENKPEDVPALDDEGSSREDEPCHETEVDPSTQEESGLLDAEVNSHDHRREVELVSDCEHRTTKIKAECTHDCLDEDDEWEVRERSSLKLQSLYDTAAEENVLLHEKISLLQQKTEILENLLAHNSEKIKTGHQVLEENYQLKVQMVLLMEHVKEVELKALKMADLQIRYEDCMCENAKLKDQNGELEKRVWSLESRMNLFHDFQDQQISLVGEIGRMREENSKLSELFGELERQSEILSESPAEKSVLDLTDQVEVEGQAVTTDLEDRCEEFEKENTDLRRAITELQDESQTLNETTQAHRSEAGRLAEENHVLRQKLSALKEEDLKEAQEEMMQRLERLKKGKVAAQKAAENFKKQISELRLQIQQLEDENGTLSERDTQNFTDMQNVRQQLAELMKENERREASEEKNKMAACVSALEAELTKALEDTARLEERNTQLSQQLSELREKVAKVDSMERRLSLLTEERQESQGLRNQLDKAEERKMLFEESEQEALQGRDAEMLGIKGDLQHRQQSHRTRTRRAGEPATRERGAPDSDGSTAQLVGLLPPSPHRMPRGPHRGEDPDNMQKGAELLWISRYRVSLNMKYKIQNISEDRTRSIESFLHYEVLLGRTGGAVTATGGSVDYCEQTCKSLRHESHLSRLILFCLLINVVSVCVFCFFCTISIWNTSFKRGLYVFFFFFLSSKGRNKKNSTFNFFCQQLVHRSLSSHQDGKERKMKHMEERMREIELSLRNIKLLLREKVAQLKDQLHKNGKADVLIKDLYVENAQLLKALEMTEQRQKIAEKKNYLLEEKISTLNKIVRDLNPSPLSSLPYHY
ncbi:Ninein [Collichthys lucidus]|uniref:Ninein n=1 Tax=Collichthys lucidus TaxID=240159 RepID=A0A4U5VH35_COLLU|nr:Ninein [Collichthys lucidus]